MKTKDPVNQYIVEQYRELGLEQLGIMNSSVWREDPKRLIFTLARYKFVAKMLEGVGSVAEIGCGDGFGSRIVRQSVDSLTITDYDPVFVEGFLETNRHGPDIEARVHDILQGPLEGKFDAIYSLDVLEHIAPDLEKQFLTNMCASLSSDGTVIIGIPSLESQLYASRESREGHVNCKSGGQLKTVLKNYFRFVFVFSMNDEVVHTGYYPMAHYLLALCCGRLQNSDRASRSKNI